jgi:O-antigen/teichoic acid export membrane protein
VAVARNFKVLPIPLAMVLIGQGFISLSSFVTVVALGRWGGDSALGTFALGWSGWFFASSLADSLIATPYTYYVNQKQRIVPDLSMVALWGIISLGIVMIVVVSILLNFASGNIFGLNSAHSTGSLSTIWPALPAAIVASLLREIVKRHYLATSQPARLLLVDCCGALLQISGIVALVYWQRLSASGALWVIAMAMLVPVLPLITISRFKRLRAAQYDCKKGLGAFFDYGRWLLLGGACHVISVQAYPWLAFAGGGERLAGSFAACIALVNLLSPVFTGLINYYRPKFMAVTAKDSNVPLSRYVWRRVPFFLFPAVVLAIILSVFGERVLGELYGPSFITATPALRWLAFGTIAVALAGPVQLGLLALGQTQSNLQYHGIILFVLALGSTFTAMEPNLLQLGAIYWLSNCLGAIALVWIFINNKKRA